MAPDEIVRGDAIDHLEAMLRAEGGDELSAGIQWVRGVGRRAQPGDVHVIDLSEWV
jgi:hypothetical protein